MKKKILFLIHGKLRTGKDEMGKVIENRFADLSVNTKTVKFADALKQDCETHLAPVLELVNSVVSSLIDAVPEYHPKRGELIELANKIVSTGENWYENKTLLTRLLLQTCGTEFARKANDDVWVDRMVKSVRDGTETVYICTDMRFENECFIEEKFPIDERMNMAFIRIKVVRGTDSEVGVVGHASEAGLPDEYFDYIIYNDGTLEEYHQSVNAVVDTVLEGIVDEILPTKK